MTSDRARRRLVVCACCGSKSAHRGHGWCVACYTRWVYWGRPPEGPPLPGVTAPRRTARQPRALPERCRSGRHPLAGANLITDGLTWRCRACQQDAGTRYRRRRFARRHDGHDVITTRDGRPYCRTCVRGDLDIDDIAVERAVDGQPAGPLRIAERELAVAQLRAWGLTYDQIARRIGGSLGGTFATCKRLGTTTPAAARAWLRTGPSIAAKMSPPSAKLDVIHPKELTWPLLPSRSRTTTRPTCWTR